MDEKDRLSLPLWASLPIGTLCGLGLLAAIWALYTWLPPNTTDLNYQHFLLPLCCVCVGSVSAITCGRVGFQPGGVLASILTGTCAGLAGGGALLLIWVIQKDSWLSMQGSALVIGLFVFLGFCSGLAGGLLGSALLALKHWRRKTARRV